MKGTWSGGGPPLQHFKALKAMTEWADDVGPKLRDATKEATPVDTGRTKKSERYERKTTGDGVRMTVTAHTPYIKYVIKGTKPHVIRPVAARALHWNGKRGPVFAKVVHHPGNRANDFPGRVRKAMRQEAVDNLKRRLQKALTE